MSANKTMADTRSPAQVAAAQTYARAKELRVAADSAVDARNRVRTRQAFDAGTLGPQDPAWEFRELQALGVEAAFAWVQRTNENFSTSQTYRTMTKRATHDILKCCTNSLGTRGMRGGSLQAWTKRPEMEWRS